MALDISGLKLQLDEYEQLQPNNSFTTIPLDQIEPDPEQPRRMFDETALLELSESIQARGVLQPIIVTPRGENGSYRIIMGERRYRASKLAGKETIPVIIRDEKADSFDWK